MIRRILIVDTAVPATVEQIAQAHALGAGEIIHPVDGELRGEFAGWAPGYHEIEYPDPEPEA